MSAGIIYPPSFLDALPVVADRPHPYPPIRAIDATQFALLHSKHLVQTASPGIDTVLFPYLHGIEHGGSNIREYFSAHVNNGHAGTATPSNAGEGGGVCEKHPAYILRAPEYRGLIWVASDSAGEGGSLYVDDGLDEEMLVDDDELNIRRPSDASTISVDSSYSLLRTSDAFSTDDSTPPTAAASFTDLHALQDVSMSDTPFHIRTAEPTYIPCSFKASEIMSPNRNELQPPKVPESISLRNFGIQVAAYARISDIVVYSPNGLDLTQGLLSLAVRLASAHESLHKERVQISQNSYLPPYYNIFILTSHPSQLPPNILCPTPSFSHIEAMEMQTLTRSSEVLPGIFLGNSADVPVWSSHEAGTNVFENSNNPYGYDLVVECVEGSSISVPSSTHLKRAEEHLNTLQSLWATGFMLSVPPARPAPNAHSILHLPFPCSPSPQAPLNQITSFISFIQGLLHPQHSSRRAKVLIYSHDGYTETSVLALALIMAEKKCTLPEAYLELQVKRGRSFFVHQGDLPLLRRLENKYWGSSYGSLGRSTLGRSKERTEKERDRWPWSGLVKNSNSHSSSSDGSPSYSSSLGLKFGRRSHIPPSANPVLHDNTTWFNHPKFDGSFPSRVLEFLYLGNLNHAINAHMLHALGITHVVSVGESALNPPEDLVLSGKPYGYGSLWLEEREGRIKVLDIKNVCDDGMDSLLPQLGFICDWIDGARAEGGKVLVHCRVGVSRSATVTIAYLMRHLHLPLVDSYLIVRSRRLSVLIQPNMRLLFNLLGWEVELARARQCTPKEQLIITCEADTKTPFISPEEEQIAKSLERALTWPYLAREVHRLNAKYIR